MQPESISKSQFKAKALEFLRQVEATGDTLVITDNGKPAVEVRRYRDNRQTPLERLSGSVVEYKEPFKPAVDPDDWEVMA